MAKYTGLSCTLLTGTTATVAGCTTRVPDVKDVSINTEGRTSDVSTRDASGWVQEVNTLKDATLEFTVLSDDTETTVIDGIRSAFFGGSEVAFYAKQKGDNGLLGMFVITGFNESQALEEGVSISVTAKPSSSTHPVWVKGGTVTA